MELGRGWSQKGMIVAVAAGACGVRRRVQYVVKSISTLWIVERTAILLDA